MQKIYLAGKITGDPNYKNKFGSAAGELRRMGYAVMNPAMLPDGFAYDEYLHICKAMIETCDTVVFLPCWKDSDGAKLEYGHAVASGKQVTTLKDALNPDTSEEAAIHRMFCEDE